MSVAYKFRAVSADNVHTIARVDVTGPTTESAMHAGLTCVQAMLGGRQPRYLVATRVQSLCGVVAARGPGGRNGEVAPSTKPAITGALSSCRREDYCACGCGRVITQFMPGVVQRSTGRVWTPDCFSRQVVS